MYSAPYPNGQKVIWVGGYDRVQKLDADTLKPLATFRLRDRPFLDDGLIRQHIEKMDGADDSALIDYGLEIQARPFQEIAVSFYRMLSEKNELYLPHRTKSGEIALRVYGDENPAEPGSAIVMKREWRLPPEITRSTIIGMNMAFDGRVIVTTIDGHLFAIAQDFSEYAHLKLPGNSDKYHSTDVMASFIRNSITVDDKGGIYLVTNDNLHRVQWTGSELSLKASDGAWTEPYPNTSGIGSGTTPGLIGWGPGEDQLVLIADGTENNNMMVFWRNEIPEDWPGLPGYSRRVAGVTPMHFGISRGEKAKIENSPVIYGYRAFFDNTSTENPLPSHGDPNRHFLAESLSMHIPGYEAKGGIMVEWNPDTRTLDTVWRTALNLASSICTVSRATEILYCWGARNREWTLEGLDWNTGKSVFHHGLGKSHRFNPIGAAIIVNEKGGIDCGCAGGLGIVRVSVSQPVSR